METSQAGGAAACHLIVIIFIIEIVVILDHVRHLTNRSRELDDFIVMRVHLDQEVLVICVGHFIFAIINVYTFFIDLDGFTQPVQATIDAIENKVHKFSTHGIVHFELFAQVESHVVFQEAVVQIVGNQHPAFMLGHAHNFGLVIQLECIRLLGFQPSRIAAAANARRIIFKIPFRVLGIRQGQGCFFGPIFL